MRPSRRQTAAFALALGLALGLLWAGAGWAAGREPDRREVRDEIGRQVQIPRQPRRLVTLTPSLAEVVCALGLGQRLAGVSEWSDFPPEVKRLPRVGSYVSPNLESIAALGADLVLASRDGNPPWAVDRLQRAGIAVYVTWPGDPRDLPASLRRLGDVCGAPQAGEALAANLERELAELASALAGVEPVSALLVIGSQPLVSVGPATFSGRLLALAGGRNLAPADGPAWPRLPLDYVVKVRPRVVILSSMGDNRDLERERAFWRALPGLAGQEGYRVEMVPSDLIDRPGPRLALGLKALAGALHPELFPGPERQP